MPLRHLRTLAVSAAIAAVLALFIGCAQPARAQQSRFAAELTRIEPAERRVTLKASMGQQTLRVAPGVALDRLKPGDKVLLTFGQDGDETVITSIEVFEP